MFKKYFRLPDILEFCCLEYLCQSKDIIGPNQLFWISVSWYNSNTSRFFFVSFMWCQSEDNSNIGRAKKGPRSHATSTLESKLYIVHCYCEC